jgi:hypothetical protein
MQNGASGNHVPQILTTSARHVATTSLMLKDLLMTATPQGETHFARKSPRPCQVTLCRSHFPFCNLHFAFCISHFYFFDAPPWPRNVTPDVYSPISGTLATSQDGGSESRGSISSRRAFHSIRGNTTSVKQVTGTISPLLPAPQEPRLCVSVSLHGPPDS